MRDIYLGVKKTKREVELFLDELHDVLNNEDFDIDRDFIMNIKKKPDDEQHSTTYTLADLDYDTYDVIERLKELSVSEYSQTLLDKDDNNPPLLYVFGKTINDKQVYIKIKIKGESRQRVLCISFHYARDIMTFPFA